MTDALVIGIDLGTSSARAAAYNSSGELIAGADALYSTVYGEQGIVEHNPSDWVTTVRSALKSVAASLQNRSGDIVAIGLSAHAPAIVPVDADGTPLLSAIPIWNDMRCVPNGELLAKLVGENHVWTGAGTVPGGHYPRLHWLAQNHPDILARARWLLSPKDLVGLWLTGNARTDPSTGSGDENWRLDVLEACGISTAILPEPVNPLALTGYLRESAAAEIDLPAGIPIVTGLNDGAAASLSARALHAGDVILTLGTNGVVRTIIPEPAAGALRLVSGVFCWAYVNGLWIIGGHTRTGANVLTWLANLLGGDTLTVEDIIDLAAAAAPGSDGLLFLPYLRGRGTPHNDDSGRGTLHGLSFSSSRSSISRAVLEGMVFALHDVWQFLPSTHQPAGIHVTGGGSRSPVWTQIIADVFNKPVMVYSAQPGLGAAIIASVAAGMHSSIDTAAGVMVHMNRQQTPVPENHDLYLQVQQRFQALANQLSI